MKVRESLLAVYRLQRLLPTRDYLEDSGLVNYDAL